MTSHRDDHLRLDGVARELRRHSILGVATTFFSQSIQFVLGLGSTALLARLLTPSDFGLVAMAAAVTNFPLLLLDFGLAAAAVQRTDLTNRQLSTLFWINTGLGVLLGVATAASAPFVVRFYGRPELLAVTLALATGLVFAGISVQHYALLQRRMQFTAIARLEIASFAVSTLVAVAGAITGAGYWALVYQQLVRQAVVTVGVWRVSGWKPEKPAAGDVRPLVTFGLGLSAFNALTYVSRNIDNVIIGRSVGSAALGLYLKSYSLLQMPIDKIRGPISSVIVPALSRLQHDAPRFKEYYLNGMTAIASAGMPIVVFLFVFANELVLTVLGPRFAGSIVLFKVLAPAAFLETFNGIGSWACTPLGRADRLLRWQAFVTTVMVVSFLVGVRWGVFGVAVAFTLSSVILRTLGAFYLLRDSPVRPAELFVELCRPACTSLAAGAILAAFRSTLVSTLGDVPSVLVAAPIFGGVYVGLWLLFPGGRRSGRDVRRVLADLRPAPVLTSQQLEL